MAAPNKIVKFKCEEQVLTLEGQGKTHRDIAQIISAGLPGEAWISQSTVSRWLKNVRKKRSTIVEPIIEDYLKVEFKADLEILRHNKNELQSLRNKVFQVLSGKVEALKNSKIPYELRTFLELDTKVHEYLRTTFRFVGAEEDADQFGTDPVDLSRFRSEAKRKVGEGGQS